MARALKLPALTVHILFSPDPASVFLNPTAHATDPTLGKVTPQLVVTEETRTQQGGRRKLVIAPPAAGYFLVDYVSVLPAGGGVASSVL